MTTDLLIHLARARTATFPLLAVMAVSGACATDAPAELESNAALRTQLGIDSAYMGQLPGAASPSDASNVAGAGGMTTRAIDLADPGQYRFVINRLTAAGKTPVNAPQLFAHVESARTRALSRPQAGRNVSAVLNGCGAFVVPGKQSKVGTTLHFINTHPEVSCFGGVPYVYADVATYLILGTQNILIGSAAVEDLNGGIDFPSPGIDSVLPIARGRLNTTDSLTIAFDDFFEEIMLFSSFSTGIQVAANIELDPPSAGPEGLPFAVSGTVSVTPTTGTGTCEILSFDQADSQLRLVKKVRGGFCTADLARTGAEKANAGAATFEAATTFTHTGGSITAECDDTTLRTEPLTVAFTIRGTARCGDDVVPFFASSTSVDEPAAP